MKQLKVIFYTGILIFLFFACKSSKKSDAIETNQLNNEAPSFAVRSNSETVIPLQVGNYWVYKYKNYNEIKTNDKLDTIKVNKVTDRGDITDYELSGYTVWAVKDGIIHRRCWGRTPNRTIENSFIKPLYFRTKKTEEFDECRGDMIIRSTINRMEDCLLYTSPSPRDQRGSRMPSSA